MPNKTNLIALIFLTFGLCLNASAEDSAICANPLKVICDETQTQRSEDRIYSFQIKNEINLEAKKNVLLENSRATDGLRGLFKSNKKNNNLKSIEEQETIKAAKIRISEIDYFFNNSKYRSLLKNYMKQAINETNFNQSTRSKLISTIDSVIITNYLDYYKIVEKDPAYLKNLNESCGLDGMDGGAFATSRGNKNYVLLCPGVLVTLEKKLSIEEKFNHVLQVISHEISHHIDSLRFGYESYRPFLSCLSDNYAKDFEKNPEDKKFCDDAKNDDKCNKQVINSHASELIADQWAAKVIAIHSKAQRLSVAQVDSLLVSSYKYLCNSQDQGFHPRGDFRIEILLRINPEVSDYLACDNSAIQRPACTFEGEK